MSQYRKFTFEPEKPFDEENGKVFNRWPYWARARFGYVKGDCHPNDCTKSVGADFYRALAQRFCRMKGIKWNYSGPVKINCHVKKQINASYAIGALFLERDRQKGFYNSHHSTVRAVEGPGFGYDFYINGNLYLNMDSENVASALSLFQTYKRLENATI